MTSMSSPITAVVVGHSMPVKKAAKRHGMRVQKVLGTRTRGFTTFTIVQVVCALGTEQLVQLLRRWQRQSKGFSHRESALHGFFETGLGDIDSPQVHDLLGEYAERALLDEEIVQERYRAQAEALDRAEARVAEMMAQAAKQESGPGYAFHA